MHLKKIRSDAAECVMLSNLVEDGKGAVFARTAAHLNELASAIEVLDRIGSAKAAGSGSQPKANPDAPQTPVQASAEVALNPGADEPAAQPLRKLSWLLVLVLGICVAAFWKNDALKGYWSAPSPAPSIREGHPQPNDTKQLAIDSRPNAADWKAVTEQLGALTVRLDDVTTKLEILNRSLGATTARSNQPEPKLSATVPSAEDPVQRDKHNDTSENEAGSKQSSGEATASQNSTATDQVGTISPPLRAAEAEPRKRIVGPAGCAQFRSFDPDSGMYTTLEGRRRRCRQ